MHGYDGYDVLVGFTLPPPPMRARGKERSKTTNLLFLMLKFPMDSGRHFF